jgi:hypothetical protein
MLAQYDWQDANRKRSREDEYEDIAAGGTLGFTEHRSVCCNRTERVVFPWTWLIVALQKRLQALPLRMSDNSKRWPAPPSIPTGQHNFLGQPAPHTVTPSDSDSEEANASAYPHNDYLQHQQQPFPGSIAPRSPPTFYMEPELAEGEDMDMMMDITEPAAPSVEQQQEKQQINQATHLQPGSLQPDPIGTPTIAGRMPTPIQPSFAAQIRGGKNWSGAVGNIMATPPPQHMHSSASGTNNNPCTSQPDGIGYHGSGTGTMLGGVSVSRPLDSDMTSASGSAVMADWNMVHNRRLPSPISENGAEGEDSQSSSDMVMDSSGATHGLHHNLISCLPPRASSAMEMGGSPPSVNVPPRVATPHVVVTGGNADGDGSMEVEAPTPSPPRKGHSRSRHTVNNWTLQPGMKKSFSIGYRADCEKCRLKVPGHFNHIIIS